MLTVFKKIVSAVINHLYFHINHRLSLSIPINILSEILNEIALNLQIDQIRSAFVGLGCGLGLGGCEFWSQLILGHLEEESLSLCLVS